MEGQKLCRKCKEEAQRYYGGLVLIPSREHCHHPEPPPCKWCEKFRNLKLTYHGTPFWETLNYLILCKDEIIWKCPVCGGEI